MDIYCTRPGCAKPVNSFPDLDVGNTVKTATQKFCMHCGMPLILVGRYITEKPLARGGFGATFTARDRYTPAMKRCVVKQLLPTGLTPQQMPIAKQMFDREGEVLEKLGTHPQIPDLLAFFPIEASNGSEFFYLVQEFIDGLTLEEVVEQHGALSESEVLEIMNSLLPVLQFVHDNHSIHRDIKPSNIMVRKQDGVYFLLDFGAVKQATAAAAANQKSTGIFTPGYGAPEQMRGDRVFPSSDLYAFAVTCICLLTGKQPEDLFDAHKNDWNWHSQVSVSPHLANILDRMLKSVPMDRFDSAQAVLDALNYSPSTQKVAAVSPPIVHPPSPPLNPTPQKLTPQTLTPQPLHPTPQTLTPQPSPAPPPRPLVLPPLGTQLFAAFLFGFELGVLGIVAITVGFSLVGQLPSLLILAGFMLTILWLRAIQVLDNKDLLIFVNIGTCLLLVVAQFSLKWATLPPYEVIALLSAIAGVSSVAITALFRLIYQVIYSLF